MHATLSVPICELSGACRSLPPWSPSRPVWPGTSPVKVLRRNRIAYLWTLAEMSGWSTANAGVNDADITEWNSAYYVRCGDLHDDSMTNKRIVNGIGARGEFFDQFQLYRSTPLDKTHRYPSQSDLSLPRVLYYCPSTIDVISG
jgi:hypothetical protein